LTVGSSRCVLRFGRGKAGTKFDEKRGAGQRERGGKLRRRRNGGLCNHLAQDTRKGKVKKEKVVSAKKGEKRGWEEGTANDLGVPGFLKMCGGDEWVGGETNCPEKLTAIEERKGVWGNSAHEKVKRPQKRRVVSAKGEKGPGRDNTVTFWD